MHTDTVCQHADRAERLKERLTGGRSAVQSRNPFRSDKVICDIWLCLGHILIELNWL